ncbi:hypothetical protein G7054_g11470 [Neopestalotiopsis clavispora]|nr:hypothetical protein G7054_g11470 [Neopestalotiopsis clavispora]
MSMAASSDSDEGVTARIFGKNNHKSGLFHGIEDEKTNKRKFTANQVKSCLYVTPFNNGAWELLKPRLLAQRADTEQDETAPLPSNAVNSQANESPYQETRTPESRELPDKDWNEAQASL